MHAGHTALVASLFISSCGATEVVHAPTYPALAPKPELSESFTAAAGVARLELPCTAHESEVDNGLDDDCDGIVDHQQESSQAAMLVTLSHPALVDVSLELRPSPLGEPPAAIERVNACDQTAPYSVLTVRQPTLPKGHYELVLTHGAACGSDVTAAVNVALWLHGRANGVYSVSLPAAATAVVGTLDVQ